MPRAYALLLVVVGSVGLDQLSKHLAKSALRFKPMQSFLGDTFRWQYAENKGAFLSLGASLPEGARYWILTVSVGALLLGLLAYTLLHRGLSVRQVVGYGFIVGGGGSNWFDRARHGGSVVDFMNLGIGSLRTGIFNIADLAIIAGVVLLVLSDRPAHKHPA